MSLADTLGWLADLVAQHVYRDDVPQPQRRRWSFDGDGFDIVDDDANEVLRISLTEAGGGNAGNVPSPTQEGSVLQSLDGSAVSWQTELQLGPDPAVQGEIRLSTAQGIYTRETGTDVRLIDTASGPVRAGDAAKVLALVGVSAEADLTDHLSVTINAEENVFVDESLITHRLGHAKFIEAVVWGRAAGFSSGTDLAEYAPGIVSGIVHVVADFVANQDDLTDFGSARLIATFKVTGSTVALVGAVSSVHDQETSNIYTPSITTDGSSIFAHAAPVAATTIDAGAKMHIVQLTA